MSAIQPVTVALPRQPEEDPGAGCRSFLDLKIRLVSHRSMAKGEFIELVLRYFSPLRQQNPRSDHLVHANFGRGFGREPARLYRSGTLAPCVRWHLGICIWRPFAGSTLGEEGPNHPEKLPNTFPP